MRRAPFLWAGAQCIGRFFVYLTMNQTAALVCLSRARIEQLLRDPQAKFPRPFQPQGTGGRRCFKQSELVAWIERGRAKYPLAA